MKNRTMNAMIESVKAVVFLLGADEKVVLNGRVCCGSKFNKMFGMRIRIKAKTMVVFISP